MYDKIGIELHVWLKGIPVPGYNPAEWRQDAYGNWMKYSDYGNTRSQYGWQIDHILPTAKGGSDQLENLRPLNWLANQRKGDKLLPV